MRPFVILKYRVANVWTRSVNASARVVDEPPQLENPSLVEAYDVSVSTLTLDADSRYDFVRLPVLHPHETLSLQARIGPSQPSLTMAISRHLVEDVLAGRPGVRQWPLKISYRDDEGRAYATWCEIRVVRLPLEIEAALISSEAEVFSPSETARSRELLAGARR